VHLTEPYKSLLSPRFTVFTKFVKTHQKTYSSSDFTRKLAVFRANVLAADDINAKTKHPWAGVTSYFDLTPSEFQRSRLAEMPIADFLTRASKLSDFSEKSLKSLGVTPFKGLNAETVAAALRELAPLKSPFPLPEPASTSRITTNSTKLAVTPGKSTLISSRRTLATSPFLGSPSSAVRSSLIELAAEAAAAAASTLTPQQIAALELGLPAAYDGRANPGFDLLGRPRDQGQCGSCWAFAAINAIEAKYAKVNAAPAVPLSEKALVDCSGTYFGRRLNCVFGLTSTALSFSSRLAPDGGVFTAASYPYPAPHQAITVDDCTMNGVGRVRHGQVTNYEWLPRHDSAIKRAVFDHGSVSVVMNGAGLQAYDNNIVGGVDNIFTAEACETRSWFVPFSYPTHVMNIVGWGTHPVTGMDYWIVRNSWGTNFGYSAGLHHPGRRGYVYMERNGRSACHVHLFSYAVTGV
jgi:C1A family cysteine protease